MAGVCAVDLREHDCSDTPCGGYQRRRHDLSRSSCSRVARHRYRHNKAHSVLRDTCRSDGRRVHCSVGLLSRRGSLFDFWLSCRSPWPWHRKPFCLVRFISLSLSHTNVTSRSTIARRVLVLPKTPQRQQENKKKSQARLSRSTCFSSILSLQVPPVQPSFFSTRNSPTYDKHQGTLSPPIFT